jgi:hypothetical protein
MSMPDDNQKRSSADRLQNIVSPDQAKENPPASSRYPQGTNTPDLHLPAPVKPEEKPVVSGIVPIATQPTVYRQGGNKFLPAFWTTASIISLLFNIVMIVLVVSVVRNVGHLNVSGAGSGVLGGLYSNFELMDAARIKTTIPVQTNIPLDLSVPVQTTTSILLAQDVTIPRAHVRITTPSLTLDAPASVTLPAGTPLNVSLNFALPVQAQVPVSLNVPVDIPIKDTELHPPILGLQDTLRPLYCMVNPTAQSLSGEPVCK